MPDPELLDVRIAAWGGHPPTMAAWHAYIARHDIDLVAMTAPTSGAPSPLLSAPGAEAMIAGTEAAVLVLPQRTVRPQFTRVLAATDLSEEAVPTLHDAEALARFSTARLDVLHVLTRRQYVALTPTDMLALNDASATPRVAARRLRTWYHRHSHPDYTEADGTALHVEQGDPVSTIARVAQAQQADIIVLAATHHPGQSGALSTLTENVLRRTTRAVLVARPRAHRLSNPCARPRSAEAPNTSH